LDQQLALTFPFQLKSKVIELHYRTFLYINCLVGQIHRIKLSKDFTEIFTIFFFTDIGMLYDYPFVRAFFERIFSVNVRHGNVTWRNYVVVVLRLEFIIDNGKMMTVRLS